MYKCLSFAGSLRHDICKSRVTWKTFSWIGGLLTHNTYLLSRWSILAWKRQLSIDANHRYDVSLLSKQSIVIWKIGILIDILLRYNIRLLSTSVSYVVTWKNCASLACYLRHEIYWLPRYSMSYMTSFKSIGQNLVVAVTTAP